MWGWTKEFQKLIPKEILPGQQETAQQENEQEEGNEEINNYQQQNSEQQEPDEEQRQVEEMFLKQKLQHEKEIEELTKSYRDSLAKEQQRVKILQDQVLQKNDLLKNIIDKNQHLQNDVRSLKRANSSTIISPASSPIQKSLIKPEDSLETMKNFNNLGEKAQKILISIKENENQTSKSKVLVSISQQETVVLSKQEFETLKQTLDEKTNTISQLQQERNRFMEEIDNLEKENEKKETEHVSYVANSIPLENLEAKLEEKQNEVQNNIKQEIIDVFTSFFESSDSNEDSAAQKPVSTFIPEEYTSVSPLVSKMFDKLSKSLEFQMKTKLELDTSIRIFISSLEKKFSELLDNEKFKKEVSKLSSSETNASGELENVYFKFELTDSSMETFFPQKFNSLFSKAISLLGACEKLRNDNSALLKNLEHFQLQRMDLMNENQTLVDATKRMKLENMNLSRNLQENDVKFKNFSENFDNLQKENHFLQEALSQNELKYENDITEMSERFLKQESDIETLKKTIKEYEHAISELNATIDQQDDEFTKLNEHSELEKQEMGEIFNREKREMFESYQNEKNKLLTLIGQKEATIRQQEETSNDLELAIEKLTMDHENDIQNMNNQVFNLKKFSKELENLRNDHILKIESLTNSGKSNENLINKLQNENEILNNEISALRKASENIKDQNIIEKKFFLKILCDFFNSFNKSAVERNKAFLHLTECLRLAPDSEDFTKLKNILIEKKLLKSEKSLSELWVEFLTKGSLSSSSPTTPTTTPITTSNLKPTTITTTITSTPNTKPIEIQQPIQADVNNNPPSK